MLSGYLINKSFDSLYTKVGIKSALKIYFINRGLRILPLFWSLTLFFYLTRNFIKLYQQNPIDFLLIDVIGYLLMLNDRLDVLNPVVWTLRIECLFYLIFPFAYIILYQIKRANRFFKHSYIFLFTLSFFFAYRYYYIEYVGVEKQIVFDVINNLEGFMLGIFAYHIDIKANFRKIFYLFAAFCVLFILLLNYIHESSLYRQELYPLFRSLSNLCLFVFFIAILSKATIDTRNVFSAYLIRYISKWSYSIYLLHFNIYYNLAYPILKRLLSSHFANVPLHMWWMVSIILTVVISFFTYKTIEEYGLSFRNKLIRV